MGSNLFNINLLLRVISAVVLIPIVVISILSKGVAFYALITVMTVLMAFEWRAITKRAYSYGWNLVGMVYIPILPVSLLWIMTQNKGEYIVLWFLSIIWIIDTAAFFAGKIIGGPKLAVSISPNKTWSGFFGGLFAAVVICILTAHTYALPYFASLVFAILVSAVAQVSDLFESWVKRCFSIKDSGSVIPGHGGVLDRLDSMIFSVLVLVIFVLLFGTYL